MTAVLAMAGCGHQDWFPVAVASRFERCVSCLVSAAGHHSSVDDTARWLGVVATVRAL